MEERTRTLIDTPTRYGLIVMAVAQGWLLYFLHLAIDQRFWPATDVTWLVSLYAVIIGVPAFFYLGLERLRDTRNLIAAALLTPLLFGLGWHLGWLISGSRSSGTVEFGFFFCGSIGVALFILALYFRSWSFNDRLTFRYSQLLEYSWQQALTMAMVGLFILVFWLLLLIWALLFKVIGIGFFADLFGEPVFIYPVTALVGGWGLVLTRERIRLIVTTRAVCEALIKALLPLAVLIAVLFLAALPFTGLDAIWDTGRAALLMMLLTVVVLFFFNAVLSDDPDHPAYPAWLRRFVLFGVMLLPVNSLLAAWALGLRIDQYGLTVDRLIAAVLQLLIAAFTLTYAVVIPWHRRRALEGIRTANQWLALLVAAVLILIHTPLADLRDWSAQSQVDRLISGRVAPDAFDYRYLRFELGQYGQDALHDLKQSDFAKNHPIVNLRIETVLTHDNRWQNLPDIKADNLSAIRSVVEVTPDGAGVPDSLLKRFIDDAPRCLSRKQHCRLVRVVDAVPGPQWWGLTEHSYPAGVVYQANGEDWLQVGTLSSRTCPGDIAVRLRNVERLKRVPGSRFVYGDGECFYRIDADDAYLRSLAAP
ncbi:DUF4153 domain-containing protein [Marinobacter halodurans]|uniref:DUF4153 domain-containing protein n=1 Tax=Marinobacter halodurans TaxID=2528979 RepID=A0ABY1ZNV9_9GAMM|nr:DUF4153 domain-containing protein [Marinobacter halodurans]TBW58417.1 DUF4153 domain-containing protein [Marinobacter halodurans]